MKYINKVKPKNLLDFTQQIEKSQLKSQSQKTSINHGDILLRIPKKGLLIDFNKFNASFPESKEEKHNYTPLFQAMGIRLEWDCEEALGYDDEIELMSDGYLEPNIITSNPRLKAQILQEHSYGQRYLFNLYAMADFLKSIKPPKKLIELGSNQLIKQQPIIEKALSKFGATFISHAHADHIPLIKLQYDRENEQQSDNPKQRRAPLQYYCPIPVLCTPLTEIFISLRFNLLINNIYHMFGTFRDFNPAGYRNEKRAPIDDLSKSLSQFSQHFQHSQNSQKEQNNQLNRSNGYFQAHVVDGYEISLIPTGHICGSAGLSITTLDSQSKIDALVEHRNSGRLAADLIYLNEYCPWDRPHVYSPPAVVCNQLVLDGLFLDPRLEFPNQEAELDRFLRWHEDTIQQSPIIIYCQELGKPQFIISAIDRYIQKKPTSMPQDYAIVVSAAMKRLQDNAFQGLQAHSVPILTKQEARKQKYPTQKNYLLFALPAERNGGAISKLIEKRKARTAEITGWCVDPSYRQSHPASEYFLLSDHASYTDTLMYLQKCNARQIFVTNTRNSAGIHALRREGFNVVQYKE